MTAGPDLSLARWCGACALGELFGLGGSFAVLALGRWLGADGFDAATPAPVRAGLGLLVGLLEGGLLGLAQGWALRARLPALSIRRLAAATALPAAVVWAVVLALMNQSAGPATSPIEEPPVLLIALIGALGGLGGGLLIGACQYLAFAPVIGRHRARLWIAASATGWAAGLGTIMVMTSVQTAETPLVLVAVLTALGAGLGGLALGLASWWGADRLRDPEADAP